MKNSELQTISSIMTIMQLILLYRRQVGVYLPEQKAYFIDSIEGEYILSPIGDESETIQFDAKLEDLFIPSHSVQLGQISPHQTLITPSLNPHDTLIEPSLNPHNTLIKSLYLIENDSVIDFKEGRNAEPIAHKIEEELLKKKAFVFENLILKKLNMEGSMRTYSTAHKNYLKYIEVVSDNNPHKLSRINKLIEEVKSNTAKMNAEKQNHSQELGKKEGIKAVAKWSFAIIISLIILFIAYKTIFPSVMNLPILKTEIQKEKVTSSKRVNTEYRIKQEITDFEKSSGLDISPWREGKLLKEAKNIEMTDYQLAEFVREYALKEF